MGDFLNRFRGYPYVLWLTTGVSLRLFRMKHLVAVLLLAAAASAQSPSSPHLPESDAVRIREFYRLEEQIAGKVWPGWGETPAPLLLVTKDTEFLTHEPNPPKDFQKIDKDLYARPRQFPTGLLATFPAFNSQSVIVISEAENTSAKTSTPWLITLMHEHFHQLQDGQPDAYKKVNALGLAHGDQTGMWMLNYAFPYEDVEVGLSYTRLRDLLVAAVEQRDEKKFAEAWRAYLTERKRFMAKLKEDDRKYLNFEIWKEGVARYTQIKCAEEAAKNYQPSPEYQALPDYESFAAYGERARRETLEELKKSDLAKSKRVIVYALGAAEAFLLDRRDPKWRNSYFQHPFTLEPYFEQ
jgi:hypothetical protein